ncbi:MAG: carbohydrate ABC transporter permease [Fimbriimonas sp.]|nr:carbohydrate ABC transporter permease [Fimbriimonas sp.]
MNKATLADRFSRWFVLLILFVGAITFMVPYYITVAMSLKSQSELATTSMWAWPHDITFENYRIVLSNPLVSFALLLKNTAIITFASTFGTLFGCTVVAYAFARLNFAGKDRLFMVLLATMMLPGILTMIPSYVMYAKIHWVNTMYPLIVPAFFGGGAFNIFLLRQFYRGLPRELDEAALIDGASHWTIFRKVILPLSGPAVATVGIFSFMGSWRDFTGPLIYLNDVDKQTLELGLRTYQSLNGTKWHLIMASTVLVSIPLIILFFIGQRYFVKGIVMTGLK